MKAWNDMTGKERAERSRKCAIGSIFIAVIFIALGIVGMIKVNNLKKRCTEVTTGEVISVFRMGKSNFSPYLTANYTVSGVKYSASGNYSSGYSSADTLSRKPVDVHYDPTDPKKAYAADSPKKGSVYILFIMGVVFAIAAPAFFWQAEKCDSGTV